MRLLLPTLLLLMAPGLLSAQGLAPGTRGAPSPDCYASGTISATGTYSVIRNSGVGCAFWQLQYYTTSNVNNIDIELWSARDGVNPRVPGSFSRISVPAQNNGAVGATNGQGSLSLVNSDAWIEVNLVTLGTTSGTGFVDYVLMGYRPSAFNSQKQGWGQMVFTGVGSGGFIATPAVCDTTANITVTAGNTGDLVPTPAGTNIFVCAIGLSMATTGTVQFIEGTGANCGTGTANITGAINLIAGTPFTLGSGYGAVMQTATLSDKLCLVAVTGNANGWINYAKR